MDGCLKVFSHFCSTTPNFESGVIVLEIYAFVHSMQFVSLNCK